MAMIVRSLLYGFLTVMVLAVIPSRGLVSAIALWPITLLRLLTGPSPVLILGYLLSWGFYAGIVYVILLLRSQGVNVAAPFTPYRPEGPVTLPPKPPELDPSGVFCPQCRAHHPGTFECSDCHVPLTTPQS